MTRGVVVGQRDEIETCSSRCVKHTMRGNFRLYAAEHSIVAIAVSLMGVKIACKPRGFIPDHGKRRFFAIELLDRNRIGIRTPFPDVWHTNYDRPTTGLDRARQVPIAGER